MKIGDLVKLKKHVSIDLWGPGGSIRRDDGSGIIIDTIEMHDGFNEHEVMFESWGVGWFKDLELEVISETR